MRFFLEQLREVVRLSKLCEGGRRGLEFRKEKVQCLIKSTIIPLISIAWFKQNLPLGLGVRRGGALL